jgi:hypothetical protein
LIGDEEPLTRGLTGMKGVQQKITKAAAILVSVFLAGDVTPQTSDKEEFEAANKPTTKARM